jgi:hypothetical protein
MLHQYNAPSFGFTDQECLYAGISYLHFGQYTLARLGLGLMAIK